MHIMHVALGGCLSGSPKYGVTEDTGGHIAYVLGASAAQAKLPGVSGVTLVTRAFDAPDLGSEFAITTEPLGHRRRIVRLRSARDGYLEKADLSEELPSLKDAFLNLLSQQPMPNVIHAHFADAAVLAQAAKERYGIPWAFHAHSLGLGKAEAGVERIERERVAIVDADFIFASSRDEAERQLLAYGADTCGKTFRVNPGFTSATGGNAARARVLLAPWLRDPTKPTVLTIARPVEKKNLITLVEAFGRHPDLRRRMNLVVLAGLRDGLTLNGSECNRVVADLFDAVDRYDLWGRVALPRKHSAAHVRDLYALAAEGGVFVNPALHEPFGLTILEAMEAGVPVAATDDGGPSDIISSVGYGRTFPATDHEALASAVLSLLDDPLRTPRAKRASETCRSLYAWDGWAREVARILRPRPAKTTVRSAPRRLLVSDMDDTLTGDHQAAATLSAALAAQTAWELVIATGRPITEARRVLADWRIAEPRCLISSVGSEIWLKSRKHAYRLDRDFARMISDGWDRAGVESVAKMLSLRPQAACEQRSWKVSFLGNAEKADQLCTALDAVGIAARVIPSHGRFIDVLPKRAGKAAAAHYVARLFALDHKSCVAAGDSGNDRDLLLWAARAVLPSNALSELDGLNHPSIHRSAHAHAAALLDALDFGVGAVPSSVAAE